MKNYQLNTKFKTKNLLMLLFIPVLLFIFSRIIFQPLEFKKYLIYAKQDFDSIQIDLNQEQAMLEQVSDNYDLSGILLYYQNLETRIIANQNYLDSTNFTAQKITKDLNAYYYDVQNFTTIKKQQADLIYFMLASQNFDKAINSQIQSTDNFSEINNILTSGIQFYANLEEDISQRQFEPQNQTLQSQIQKHIINLKDYYSQTSTLINTLTTAQSAKDLGQVRSLQKQFTQLKQAFSSKNSEILNSINQEVSSQNSVTILFNQNLIQKTQQIKLSLQMEMDDFKLEN